MKPFVRTTGRALLGLSVGVALAQALAGRQPLTAGGTGSDDRRSRQERYLYVATIAQSAADPDFVTVIGADPGQRDFGRIVNRIDMPNVGDELHHFGYSSDQRRLIVPGLFSNRTHVFDILDSGRRMRLKSVNEDLASQSGYIIPHSVIAPFPGYVLVTMIGAATANTQPGGIVVLDDRTGAFVGHFGPGPAREPGDAGPRYMYDFDALPEANRGISSTIGPPGVCGGGIEPGCLGDEVAVWDLSERKVVQTAGLGANSGALEVRFIDEPGVRRAFVNTPGTSAVWLADDDATGLSTSSRSSVPTTASCSPWTGCSPTITDSCT